LLISYTPPEIKISKVVNKVFIGLISNEYFFSIYNLKILENVLRM